MKKVAAFLLLLSFVSVIPKAIFANGPDKDKVYDAIIVPGYPYRPDGELSIVYKLRLLWAQHLYQTGRTKKIIVSGSAVHSPYVEAKIFAMYLLELGIDPNDLIIEDKAEHSVENVLYSLEIAENMGYENVAVATDLWQSGMIQVIRAVHSVKMKKVDFLPARLKVAKESPYWDEFDLIIDGEKAYVPQFVPLKERKPKKIRLKGTRGRLWKPSDEVTFSYATELL